MMPLHLWPDDTQRLLLHAALDDGQVAIDAFRAWCCAVDFSGDIDGGSFRLLPLAYTNLSRLGCTDPLMTRLRGVYRHSWCDAQIHLRRGSEIVGFLADRNIPTLVSKGLPLAALYYTSVALRPMSDIDLVVPRGQAREAVAALESAGWELLLKKWRTQPDHMLVTSHAVSLSHPKHGLIDVHWRLFFECLSSAFNKRIWQRAEPFLLSGTKALSPGPPDMLLHVIVHGMQPNPLPPLRWIADAAMILRREGDRMDWDDLRRNAREIQVSHRVAVALLYLHRDIGLSLPAEIVAWATRTKPSWVERLEIHVSSDEEANAMSRRERWMGRLSFFGRFLFSDRRKDIPRLMLRWLRQRLSLWQEAVK
jgi:hypothetical protein